LGCRRHLLEIIVIVLLVAALAGGYLISKRKAPGTTLWFKANPELETPPCPNCGSTRRVRKDLKTTGMGWTRSTTKAWACADCGAMLSKTVGEGTSEWRKCPECAERVRAEAVKCKHCGSSIEGNSPHAEGN
jgi:DNA-directed RNA polymerase subunit RPC12/RpoP